MIKKCNREKIQTDNKYDKTQSNNNMVLLQHQHQKVTEVTEVLLILLHHQEVIEITTQVVAQVAVAVHQIKHRISNVGY